MHEQIFKQAELESAAGSTRFLYRNFAGGTLEPSDDGA
jgi:pyrroloquinoline quinone biosynthesis protein E